MSDPQQPPKKRGCFFYGCITCLALGLLFLIVVGLGAWFLIHTANQFIADYTDTVPMAMPKVDMPPEELAALNARIDEFKHALAAHTNTPPLVLTSRDINAYLADTAAGSNLNVSDKFYVDLEGDHIKAQVSFPLDEFKFPGVHTAGRYLNGTGDLSAEVTNSAITVTILALEVKGKPLPAQFMTSLQQKNLAESYNENPTNTEALSHLDSVEVKNSTLVIKAKPQ